MDRRRLIYYVLLNIFVSACVTGAILYFYDRTSRFACGTVTTPQGAAVASPAAGSEIKVNIVSVIGAGTATNEIVVVQNNGAEPLILTGWYLKDSHGNTYTFPQLTLYPQGVVQVHTASGDDSALDLYWGRTAPVWQSGEQVRLYDAQGVARSFYRVP
jgi:hypothetical protein